MAPSVPPPSEDVFGALAVLMKGDGYECTVLQPDGWTVGLALFDRPFDGGFARFGVSIREFQKRTHLASGFVAIHWDGYGEECAIRWALECPEDAADDPHDGEEGVLHWDFVEACHDVRVQHNRSAAETAGLLFEGYKAGAKQLLDSHRTADEMLARLLGPLDESQIVISVRYNCVKAAVLLAALAGDVPRANAILDEWEPILAKEKSPRLRRLREILELRPLELTAAREGHR